MSVFSNDEMKKINAAIEELIQATWDGDWAFEHGQPKEALRFLQSVGLATWWREAGEAQDTVRPPALVPAPSARPVAVDAIAQKIYEDRYQDPKHPEIALYLRDGVVREVVQRTLELTIGDLPVDVLVDLIDARATRNEAHAVVTAWMQLEGARENLVQAQQAPGWGAYDEAVKAWTAAIARLDAWINREEHP